jgi:hypothetical protein
VEAITQKYGVCGDEIHRSHHQTGAGHSPDEDLDTDSDSGKIKKKIWLLWGLFIYLQRNHGLELLTQTQTQTLVSLGI